MIGRFFRRFFPVLALASNVALWVVATVTLGRIEGPYPTGFDAAGQPDRFAEGDFWLFPLVGLFLLLFAIFVVAGSHRLAVVRPALVNVPRKRDWLRLPTPNRLRALEPLSSLVYGLALFANLLFVSVTLDTYGVATGALTRLPETKLLVAVGGVILWIVLSMLRFRQAVGDEVRAARRAAAESAEPATTTATTGSAPPGA